MIIVDGCPENFNYSYFIPRIVLSKNNEYSISLFCHRIGENPIIVHVDHIIFVTEFKPEISSDLIGITLFSKPPKIDKIHLIHLLDPIRGNINDQFIEMRCGMSTGIRFGAQKYTTNPEEVTCQRCRNRIENPLMALRKYGQVRVFSEFALSMNYNAWYPIDLVMYSTSKNTYAIASTIKNKQGHLEFIDASNMDDAINKLLTYYETELIPISK